MVHPLCSLFHVPLLPHSVLYPSSFDPPTCTTSLQYLVHNFPPAIFPLQFPIPFYSTPPSTVSPCRFIHLQFPVSFSSVLPSPTSLSHRSSLASYFASLPAARPPCRSLLCRPSPRRSVVRHPFLCHSAVRQSGRTVSQGTDGEGSGQSQETSGQSNHPCVGHDSAET